MREGTPQLAARPRQLFGKKTRFLRREGWTPANVFGHRVESLAVEISTREVEHLFAHVPRSALISLVMDSGRPRTVLIRQVTRKPTTGELYHVDFYQVSMTEVLKADVPIVLTGDAPAVRMHGATLLHALNALSVECLPGDLPTRIEIDLERLVEVDDAIHVGDLPLPPGVTALADSDELVVKALAPQVPEREEEAVPEEAAAVPTEAEGSEAAAES